ncbi:MAG: S8 family serine peptidase [Deltaproteobacteria bacterium]|nr:S8 family serine peptidase [Deltaproteobacteria bacterium]
MSAFRFSRHVSVLVALMVFVMSPAAAYAARFDDALVDALAEAAPGETLNVYVVMAESVDLSSLTSYMDDARLTRAQRHLLVVEELQDMAASTQSALLGTLAGAGAAVRRVRPFWIANAVAVEADAAYIESLRARRDIASVYLDPPLELIEPVAVGDAIAADDVATGILGSITASRAPELWAMGYDGTGALACDQDTGADATHPAFADRWRGLDGGVLPEHAWFDPVGSETFPTDSGSHGTHTLGTILGDDGAGHQIGMAPGAKWIGAKTIDVPGGNIYSDAIAAFEWMADPDGNPGTVDDVPDAVNNSWGIPNPSCANDFYAAIDAAEAAGVVVLFAAGNEGPAAKTLRSPGNRITTSLNTFSVGALKQDNTTITSFSSRGPSRCDNLTLKPEVSAIGDNVLSSVPGNNYSTMSGTSMATPAVTGAAILLRGAFPEATVDQVKMALYETAVDLGAAGEDNIYGRGRIDVVEAYWWLLAEMVTSNATLSVDRALYSCDDLVRVTVTEGDLSGSLNVTVKSTTEAGGETLALAEDVDVDGLFRGQIATATGAPAADGVLQLTNGDTITVTYTDANDGEGGINVVETKNASADCAAPAFAGATGATGLDNEAEITWDPATDLGVVVYNIYRADASGGHDFDDPIDTATESPWLDQWAPNGADWYYVVRACDPFGNCDGNTVEVTASPTGPDRIFFDNFDLEPRAWQIVDGGSNTATWNSDNAGSRSSPHWTDRFIAADKETTGALQRMDEQLITPPLDCSHHEGIELRFRHEYRHGLLDRAQVAWSYDGATWTNLVNWGADQEGAVTFDLPEADLYPQVFVLFYFKNAGLDAQYWGLDNIEVVGWPSTGTPTTTTSTTTSTTTTTIPGDDDTDDDTADDDADDDTADDDIVDDDTTDDDTVDDDVVDDDTTDDDTIDDDSLDDDTADDDTVDGADDSGGNNNDGGCGC